MPRLEPQSPLDMVEYINVDLLRKNPNNPRIVKDTMYQKLLASLQSTKGREVFEARPCIVSTRLGKNTIIAGNTRFQAAKDLGWEAVPTVIMENLTELEEQEIAIRDNVSNGEWDFDTLYNEWDTEKLEEWGVELPIKSDFEEPGDIDDVEPTTKLPTMTITAFNQDDLDMIREEIEPIVLRYVGAYLDSKKS